MSITAVSGTQPPLWVWAVWLVAAIAVGVIGLLRPKRPVASDADCVVPTGPPQGARFVPLLAVTGLISFCAWVATQLIYVSVRQPMAAGAIATWSPADLAWLSLGSALVGWAVGFGLLCYGGGVRAVGYGIRRVPGGLLAGAIGIFVALPIVFFCLKATLAIFERLRVQHPAKHELLQVMEGDSGQFVRVMAVVAATMAAPLFEEMLFRGCVQGGLRRVTGSPWISIGVASLMFAAIHPPWTIPPIFVFSILLGLVYERTRNLWATTVMHALFNGFAIFTSGMD